MNTKFQKYAAGAATTTGLLLVGASQASAAVTASDLTTGISGSADSAWSAAAPIAGTIIGMGVLFRVVKRFVKG